MSVMTWLFFVRYVLKRIYMFFFAVCILSAALLCAVHAEEELASGIYTIKNQADGTYLNAFDFAYAKDGYAYTAKYSGEEGENILLIQQEDGTYLLYPQSESGKYAFYVSDSAAGTRICKSEELTSGSYFRISNDGNGYVISTAEGNVLGTTEKQALYRMRLVTTETYSGEATQLWDLEAVPLSNFTLKTVTDEVRVNSVSAVYAVVTPAYMRNFVTWSSSDESIVMIDDDGTFCALSAGTATVTATINDLCASIDVTVVDEDAPTWYSQHLAYDGGWHAADLTDVYFYSGSYKRFIINGFNRGMDWMDEGCAITAVAIVLRNLGARYEKGYDFRFEADGDLEADPYTVALANTGNRGLTESKGTLYYNPILMNLRVITANFTLYGQPITYTQTYGVSKKRLKETLDQHPEGVIVSMKNSYNGSHYIVVTECINPTAADPNDYRFKISDPSGLHGSKDGEDVLFEKSISYVTMRYRYSNFVSMIYFDIVE
ncbi:MAG: Ig-like domain-containing protein [Clostridia bacterium]|nr:Ig-like domain-containing protein [Clostridia bacterium]